MSIWATSTWSWVFVSAFLLVCIWDLSQDSRWTRNTLHFSLYCIPAVIFSSPGSETRVPFSPLRRASREFEYTSSSYLYKIPTAAWEYGREEWFHVMCSSCCALQLKKYLFWHQGVDRDFGLEKQLWIISSYIVVTISIRSVLLRKSFHKVKTTFSSLFFTELPHVGL